MHHFVVIFKKKFRLGRQGGIDPPNQNRADALVPNDAAVTTASSSSTAAAAAAAAARQS